MLELWEHGNQKIDTSICYSIILFPYANSDEKLYNISYLEKTSKLFTKTFLERTYFLDGRIFCMQCRKCFRRDAEKIYRKPSVKKVVTVGVKSI